MSEYKKFLDFFSMHNKERLDGLNESYFTEMTQEERGRAFNYLLEKMKGGGTEESVHGLFLADAERASTVTKMLLDNRKLREDAEIAAAWNLYRMNSDSSLLAVFIRLMSSTDRNIRAKAAYYVPCSTFIPDLIAGLQGMIRTETDMLASINATNKLLECYGVTRDSVTKEIFSKFYKGLRSDDLKEKETTFKQLEFFIRPADSQSSES